MLLIFNELTPAFKGGNKVFALSGVDNFSSINLKAHSDRLYELATTKHIKDGL